MIARTVLGTLFIASVLALKLSGAPDVLTFSYTPIYIYTLAIYATTPVLGYIHRRQERWLSLAFTYGLTSVDLALVSWLALYTGGSSSPFLFLYLFIIIGAAMLRQRRGALIMTALSMGLLGSIIVLEFHGAHGNQRGAAGRRLLQYLRFLSGRNLEQLSRRAPAYRQRGN